MKFKKYIPYILALIFISEYFISAYFKTIIGFVLGTFIGVLFGPLATIITSIIGIIIDYFLIP